MRTRFRFETIPSPSAARSALLRAILAVAIGAAAACGHGGESNGAAGAPGRGGPPPGMPVGMITLAPKPIEQSTEFVGTIKSRHSISVQPQVEGYLTRIAVKSGDQVKPGTVL